jgi:hypothetical protein
MQNPERQSQQPYSIRRTSTPIPEPSGLHSARRVGAAFNDSGTVAVSVLKRQNSNISTGVLFSGTWIWSIGHNSGLVCWLWRAGFRLFSYRCFGP